MADAQHTVELLTSTAVEMKIDADNKTACYFKSHARALELAIDRKPACDDANGDLLTLENEYHTAGAAANVTNKIQQLTRRLAKTKPKGTPKIADAVTRIVVPPSAMPAAIAETIREVARPFSDCCRPMCVANGPCQV